MSRCQYCLTQELEWKSQLNTSCLFRKGQWKRQEIIYLSFVKCMASEARCVFILWTHQIALLGNDDRGSSNRQKASGQHKLQASNSRGSADPFCTVSHGQDPVLWHLEEEWETLANCTLENDKPLEHSKVRLRSKKKVVCLWTPRLLFYTEFQAFPIKHGKFASAPTLSWVFFFFLLFLVPRLKCFWFKRWRE